jgi:hypothetical protein
MLVHCPKCNFSQPKDAYCAKCGIEMDRYRPEKKPLLKTLIKNPITHIVLSIAGVFLVYTAYINPTSIGLGSNNTGQPLSSLQNRKSGYQHSNQRQNANPENAPNPSNGTNGQASPNLNAATNSNIPNQQVNGKSAVNIRAPSNSDSDKNTEQPSLANGPWTLQVRFIELSATAYQQWISEAQSLEAYVDTGEFVMGKVIKSKKNFGKSLDNATKNFSDLKTTKTFIGSLSIEPLAESINFSFNLNQDSNGAFIGEFDLALDDSSGTNKKQFNSSFEMKSSELLFIRSAMPHNSGKTDSSDAEYLIIFDFQSSH